MSQVMLTFGAVAFSVDEAAYRTLARTTAYRVPAQDRVGERPALQYVGPGRDNITLAGTIMPTWRGRPGALDDLRAAGAAGESKLLMSGAGESFGRWVVAEVDEERSALFANGAPRKIDFTVKLERDDDAPRGALTSLRNAASATGSTAAILDAVSAAVAAGEGSAAVIAAAEGA